MNVARSRRIASRLSAMLAALSLLACGSSSPPASVDGGAPLDGGALADGGPDGGGSAGDGGLATDGGAGDGGVDKAAGCASTFGTALTNAYGRLDGTVRAVVPPAHPTCPRPNNDHMILEVDMGGGTYRMVLNVQSDRAGQDPRVASSEIQAPLAGRAWQEGWWPGETIQYASALAAHSAQFTPHEMGELVGLITDRLTVGARVSVYASSSGGDSAHLIHRNDNGLGDGAIVVDPTGERPIYLAFRFSNQTF